MKNAIKNILIFVITLAAVFNLQTQNAKAAWGDFDTSFSFQGVSIDTLTDHYPVSVAIQPDGKILVTGYRLPTTGKQRFFLRRYLSSGQPDTSFGNNGSAVSNALINTNAHYRGAAIAVLPDGKIAVAGNGDGAYAVWRFSLNGYGDNAIGNGGFRRLPYYNVSGNPAIAVQSGKLIIGLTDQARAVLLRLNNNGSLDTTFGSAGEVVPTEVGGFSISVIVESGTNNITVGSSQSITGPKGLERFFPNGQRDTNFIFADRASEGFATKFIRLSSGPKRGKYIIQIYPGFYGLPERQFFTIDNTGAWEKTNAYGSSSSSGYCPNILAQQQNGKVIFGAPDRLLRLDSYLDMTSSELNYCSNFSYLTNITDGVLQTDDKMIVAGRYSGYLTLVRTLPN